MCSSCWAPPHPRSDLRLRACSFLCCTVNLSSSHKLQLTMGATDAPQPALLLLYLTAAAWGPARLQELQHLPLTPCCMLTAHLPAHTCRKCSRRPQVPSLLLHIQCQLALKLRMQVTHQRPHLCCMPLFSMLQAWSPLSSLFEAACLCPSAGDAAVRAPDRHYSAAPVLWHCLPPVPLELPGRGRREGSRCCV